MTETHPHLPNAPIVEALIDIRVRLEDDFDVMRLRGVHEGISGDDLTTHALEAFQ